MENNVQNQKTFPFLRLLRTNALLIVLITVLVTMLSVLYNFVCVKPVYTVSRSVILSTQLPDETEANNGVLAEYVIVQMESYFKSPKYIALANEEFKRTNPDIKSTINAGSIKIIYNKGSLIFKIAYSDSDKDLAAKKLIAIYNVNTTFFEDIQVSNQSLIPTDNSGTDPSRFQVSVSNQTMKYLFLGLGVGLVLAIAVVFIKNALDNTVKDSVELEELTGVSVIAAISKQKDSTKRKMHKSKPEQK